MGTSDQTMPSKHHGSSTEAIFVISVVGNCFKLSVLYFEKQKLDIQGNKLKLNAGNMEVLLGNKRVFLSATSCVWDCTPLQGMGL